MTLEIITDGLKNMLKNMENKTVLKQLLDEIGLGSVAKTKKKIAADESILPPGRKHKLSGKTMIETNEGAKSIKHEVDIDKGSVAIGTNIKYMAINRDGIPEEGIKGRGYEFLFLLDENEIGKLLAAWLKNIEERSK
ncbi:MAG: hypothetical protein EOM23_07065 [Candidatus Moranbacteria bacterium]|nr:hypothetical protein [Candidatus Moranbacteria bacterium]